MKDYEQIHDIILEKLDTIQNQVEKVEIQTTKTNGRVTDLEKETVGMKKDIAEALKIISGHSSIITYYKQERDKAQEDLIKQQKEKIDKMEIEKQMFNKRVIIAIVCAIGFILISLGLVNKEVVKIFLGIL